jgi:hypothetical protein
MMAGREIERIAGVAFAQVVNLPKLWLGQRRIRGRLLGERVRELYEHLAVIVLDKIVPSGDTGLGLEMNSNKKERAGCMIRIISPDSERADI